MPTFVQAEFFLDIGMSDPSLEQLLAVSLEAARDGAVLARHGVEAPSALKLVVRFVDHGDVVLNQCSRFEALKAKEERVCNSWLKAKGISRLVHAVRLKLLTQAREATNKQKVNRLAVLLREAIARGEPVARERPDFSFRLQRADEEHEAISAAERSWHVAVFVFEAPGLLANPASELKAWW